MLNKSKAIESIVIQLRRDIHQHPELAFKEHRTAQLVASTLRDIGYKDIQTEVGKTGVVAQIGLADGQMIGIRADMDALPLQEATDVPFRSVNEGVMHACGHDAHTAMLLGVAQLLYESYVNEAKHWRGGVRLIFQPSEEAQDDYGVSGAAAMISDHALDNLDAVIALHIGAKKPSGIAQFCDGYAMAASDYFRAWIRGDGSHGAQPEKGRDPFFMLSAILPQIYGIPSRRIEPLEPCVISVGTIRGGGKANIIPNEVFLDGTIRSFKPEVRERIRDELEKAFETACTMGGSSDLEFDAGSPSLFNDARVNDWMRRAANDLCIEQVNHTGPLNLGSEDFAKMTQKVPGAMFLLGASNGGGAHHQVDFDFDEGVLYKGAALLAETARRFVLRELTMDTIAGSSFR
jgi:amidohydrolase